MPSKSALEVPKASQRLPPPSLFQGPPSRNASTVDLTLPGPASGPSAANHPSVAAQRIPLLRNRSSRPVITGDDPTLDAAYTRAQQKTEGDKADALWAEMQSTLAEVELSAVDGTHVFGAEHAKALEDLRTTQLALAQAWSRSEADEALEHHQDGAGKVVKGAGLLGADPIRPGSSGSVSSGAAKQLENETESDILLARKRREANDRYFQRVNTGVLDVVAKLEDVALAMRAVEKESRDLWSESDSIDTGAASATSAG